MNQPTQAQAMPQEATRRPPARSWETRASRRPGRPRRGSRLSWPQAGGMAVLGAALALLLPWLHTGPARGQAPTGLTAEWILPEPPSCRQWAVALFAVNFAEYVQLEGALDAEGAALAAAVSLPSEWEPLDVDGGFASLVPARRCLEWAE